MPAYVRSIGKWLPFAGELGFAQASSLNRNSYLGQIWNFLNPILNSLVYILVFGVMLGTTRGVENVVAFIVTGVFTFRFFGDVIGNGGKSIRKGSGLMKSLPFPRAVLPISQTITEFAFFIPEMVAMLIIIKLSGALHNAKPVHWGWDLLLLPVALIIAFFFSLGCAFIVARWVAFIPDLARLVPFCLRLVMYGSGAIFPVMHYFSNPTIVAILKYQPVAVLLELVRQVTLNEPTIPFEWSLWLWGVGWAAAAMVIGLIYFWRAEARYGRE
ncbi:ABC transporter permease [Rarobacter incanus]